MVRRVSELTRTYGNPTMRNMRTCGGKAARLFPAAISAKNREEPWPCADLAHWGVQG